MPHCGYTDAKVRGINMAKPRGPKSIQIRNAIAANPDMGNTGIAEMLNDAPERMDDKIKVSAQDVASQRQAMRKSGGSDQAAKKPAGQGGGRQSATPPVNPVPTVEARLAAASAASPV